MQRRTGFFVAACWLAFPLAIKAHDWPQFRGPNRDGISKDTGLLKEWPKTGPALLWTFADAGVGYSGPAVVGDRLYTMGARKDTEYLIAIDINRGQELWSARIGPIFTWEANNWNAGPSATPAVDGELVYAVGGQGELVCVETASGKERWRRDLTGDLGGEVNPIGGGLGSREGDPKKLGWGYTWSPLVDGDQLICVPGGPQGTLAALNKKTGKVLWRSKGLTDQASYSSPIVASVGGLRHYVQLTNQGVTGVAAKEGKVLWHYRRDYSDVVIPTPIFHDDKVYITAGWGAGCDLIKLAAAGQAIKAAKVYANKNMKNRHGGVVLVGEHLYGYSEGKGWVCQVFDKGLVTWSEKQALGPGSLVYADGRLYCYDEDNGVVALVEANLEGWKEHGRFEIPRKSAKRLSGGKLWTHPVVANGRLYLRDQELLFCYDVGEHARVRE